MIRVWGDGAAQRLQDRVHQEAYAKGLPRQGSFSTKGMLLQNVSARCDVAAARLHRPLAACCQRPPLACTAPFVPAGRPLAACCQRLRRAVACCANAEAASPYGADVL